MASMANTRLDQMLVAPLISASALGVYSVAVGATILPLGEAGVAIASLVSTRSRQPQGLARARMKACRVSRMCRRRALGILLFLEPIYGHPVSTVQSFQRSF